MCISDFGLRIVRAKVKKPRGKGQALRAEGSGHEAVGSDRNFGLRMFWAKSRKISANALAY